MGKIPPIVTIVIGIVLLAGISAAFFFLMVKPKSTELTEARAKFEQDSAKAKTLPTVKAQYEQAVADWVKAQADLNQLMTVRSTPISFYTPIPAWIALWQEYRVTMPGVIERFVRSFGLRIVSGVPMPPPPAQPPPAPPNGYMSIPDSDISLTVQGTLAQLEKFYRSIKYCPRVMTVGGLSLSGTGNVLTAQIPMHFYLLVETPPGAAPAAAGPVTGQMGGPQSAPPGPATSQAKPSDDGGDDTEKVKPKIGKGGDAGDE